MNRIGVAFVAVIFCLTSSCSCDLGLPGALDKAVNRVVDSITSVQNTATSTSHDWQNEVNQIEGKLSADASDLAKQTLTKVQQIAQESAQLVAEHIPCNEDIISDHVNTRLNNIIHELKHDGKSEVYIPRVCGIAPATIELSTPGVNHLSIDGAFFFDALPPRLAIQNDDGVVAVAANAVSRSSNYAMTVNLDQIKQTGLIGPTSRKLLIYSPPNTQIPLEVAIQQAVSCIDHIKNGNETDVDCGGSCTPCSLQQMCTKDEDCSGKACLGQRCGMHLLGARNPQWLHFAGGTGGNRVTESSCGVGEVAVGFFAKAGNYFDSMGLWCTKLHPDGVVAEPIKRAQVAGGDGGNHEQSYFCPVPGQVLVGLFGRSGDAIDQVGGFCTTPHRLALNAPQIEKGAAIAPSTGGAEVSANCAAQNGAVTALQIRSGDRMDSISFACSPIILATSGPGNPALFPSIRNNPNFTPAHLTDLLHQR